MIYMRKGLFILYNDEGGVITRVLTEEKFNELADTNCPPRVICKIGEESSDGCRACWLEWLYDADDNSGGLD